MGVDVGGNKSRPISHSFHSHRSVYHDGSRINGSILFARPATIGGKANDRSRSGGGNDEWERFVVKSTTNAVVSILDEACDTTGRFIFAIWGWIEKVADLERLTEKTISDSRVLGRVVFGRRAKFREDGRAICRNQSDIFSAGIEAKVGVKIVSVGSAAIF